MGKAAVKYKEVRFVIDDEITHAYVLCEAIGDCPLGVQGWHYKAYPASVAIDEIVTEAFAKDDPVLWPQKAP